jgi:hypothetical protein
LVLVGYRDKIITKVGNNNMATTEQVEKHRSTLEYFEGRLKKAEKLFDQIQEKFFDLTIGQMEELVQEIWEIANEAEQWQDDDGPTDLQSVLVSIIFTYQESEELLEEKAKKE